jgi:hypothetical protein
MASLSTPQVSRKRPDESQSPSLKNDGISPQKNHLPRSEVVQQIYDTARDRQHVVIGSSAATGKTSLLQLLKKKLVEEEEGANVIRIHLNSSMTVQHLMELLTKNGISTDDLSELEQIKNTWLLLDDAQNAYDRKFDPFWQFVVKSIASAEVDDNLFVVIAATYNLSTPKSPADFRGLARIDPNVTEKEARELFQMHAEVWGYKDWNTFRETLIDISKFSESKSYHVGVVMAGVRMLADKRKQPDQPALTEERALALLRKEEFVGFLDRCFRLPDDLPVHYKDRLLDVVIEGGQDVILDNDALLTPFIRAGLLTRSGKFSNIAARWYYNHRCFPYRAAKAPENLDELISLAVGSISAKRLRDTLVDGFPKEATFQHLFNEAMSQLLPLDNAIIPELNTLVTNPPSGPDVTGELDFYVDGKLKWCVELLRNGIGIGEHIGRFDLSNGKYRKVDMNEYIVVDCRGPKMGGGVKPSESRCTLYFAEDFKHCLCQMRTKGTIRIELAN